MNPFSYTRAGAIEDAVALGGAKGSSTSAGEPIWLT